jgi:hypothetical protein
MRPPTEKLEVKTLFCENRNGHHNGTQNAKATQKTNKMSNTDSTKKRELTHVLAKDKRFLLHIRYLPCYSYIIKSGRSLGGDIGKKTST